MSLFRSNFNLPDPEDKVLPEEEQQVIDKIARKVVEKGMSVPAIMFLESVKPMNFIGAQAMVFFEPIVQSIFSFRDYDTLRTALEKRQTIEILLLKIEELDAAALQREKRVKAFMKEQKKGWKWYQRWLGVGRPRVQVPEEILNPPETEPSDGSSDSR